MDRARPSGPARQAGPGGNAVRGVIRRERGNELRVRKVTRRDPAMKLWKLVLAVTIVGVVVLLVAGRNDIARFQSMRRM